jgi:hypothetical protein
MQCIRVTTAEERVEILANDFAGRMHLRTFGDHSSSSS